MKVADEANSFLIEWLFANIMYKIEDCESNIPAIISMIKSCLSDYEGHISDFDEYRKMIRQEHAWFSKDVKDIFGLLTSS